VHHVALRTPDITALAGFYLRVFAIPELKRNARSVWLQAGATILMIEQREAGEPPVMQGSQEMFALGIAPTERAALYERLAQEGATVETETEFTVYFRDPEGRRIGASHYPLPRP